MKYLSDENYPRPWSKTLADYLADGEELHFYHWRHWKQYQTRLVAIKIDPKNIEVVLSNRNIVIAII